MLADRLRMAIARACRATGTPLWSPHDLRHQRISLLHRQGRSWAEVGRFVGQRKISLTADVYTHVLSDGDVYTHVLSDGDVYTHVLSDGRELEYREVLA